MTVKVIRFAPGLKPVFKHGTGDQKPHGNWATGNVGNFTLDASSDPMGLTTYNHPNGSRIIFQGVDNYYDGDGNPTPEKKEKIAQAIEIIDSLQNKYPIKDLTIVFENDPNGENSAVYPILGQTVHIGRDTAPKGMTVIYPQGFLSPQLPKGKENAPYIVMNSMVLGNDSKGVPYTFKTITEENGNFYNPNHVIKGKSGLIQNVLTHEYGHALDNNSQSDSITQWYDATEQNTSSYGLSNKREFFAETFTAWEIDKTNPRWQESFKITNMASLGSKVNKAVARGFIVKDRFDGGEPFLQEFGEVLKHEGGGHDQSSHGSWANGSNESGLDSMPYGWKPKLNKSNMTDEEYAKNAETLKNIAKAPVSTYLYGSELDLIVQEGRFKSLNEIPIKNEGLVMASEEYRQGRSELENDLWGVPKTGVQPIYGFMDTEYGNHKPATIVYGDVKVTLKDNVSGRTTFSAGDSLNSTLVPVKVSDARAGTLSKPAMAGSFTSQKTETFIGQSELRSPDRIGYFEAQVHGGISLKDIKTVSISQYSRVAQSTQDTLKALGVEVIRLNDNR